MTEAETGDRQDLPISDLIKPLLDAARAERTELVGYARALLEQAQAADHAVKARHHDLAWLDELIKGLPEDNKRLLEYQKIRDSQVAATERLEAQAQEKRGAADSIDERLRAVEAEIGQLEKRHTAPTHEALPGPASVAEEKS